MSLYKNVMEELVEEIYDQMSESLGCCKCERCRNDVIAYTLNQLPSKYIVTQKGEAYSKTYGLSVQYRANMITALAEASKIVQENPRH